MSGPSPKRHILAVDDEAIISDKLTRITNMPGSGTAGPLRAEPHRQKLGVCRQAEMTHGTKIGLRTGQFAQRWTAR
jgi:hypothetical protein